MQRPDRVSYVRNALRRPHQRKTTKRQVADLLRAQLRHRPINLSILIRAIHNGINGKAYSLQVGDTLTFRCPNLASVRYIRRRLEDLARELDGMAIEAADEDKDL